ncbi:MAG: Fe-S cluster assembly protein HesB [Microbacteriaceae bacterium]|nr:MAG: Fe-S cluster assembly protein HesB [Microbacteriaceae bacterium]
MAPELHLTGDAAADALLSSDPLALVIGMLLDQQVPMETAFAGPAKIAARMGDAGSIDAAAIASSDPEAFVQLFRATPAVHRFPGSMAARVQTLCRAIVDDWGGDAAAIWSSGNPTGAEVLARLKKLPGFGDQKAKIFLALLGKQYGLDAPGWREASAPLGEPGTLHSVADIVDADSLARVRESKKAHRAAMKAARG